ncbi:Early nodulin-93 [Nymphaea thermarum]|nr:Early nodulin-93 [Nymphaea thermarum]
MSCGNTASGTIGLFRPRDQPLVIPSPHESPKLSYQQQKDLNAKRCTEAGVRAGMKAAGAAAVGSAIPTLIGVRVIPWAKANLNHTAQALIISAASTAAYFITSDKTILECARRNSRANYEKLMK